MANVLEVSDWEFKNNCGWYAKGSKGKSGQNAGTNG